jgi:hypothetical protein
MNITFACPHCDEPARLEFSAKSDVLECPNCRQQIRIPEDAWEGDRLRRCLVCPSSDLYVRKDFPQILGVSLVAIGILGSSVAWAYAMIYWTFGILFATALADVILYALVGDALMCYRCHAQYRGLAEFDEHGAFDLETHERYRQQAARTIART